MVKKNIAFAAMLALLSSSAPVFSALADPAPDIDALTAAAKDGDARAQYTLGMAYVNGTGVDKDGPTAARWLRKSAAQEYPQAEYQLGAMYINLPGDPSTDMMEDPLQADKWLHRGAERGNADSMRRLGRMYQTGTGETKNETQAFMWLELASALGDTKAGDLRNEMMKTIPADKVTDARSMADEWKKSHDKLFH